MSSSVISIDRSMESSSELHSTILANPLSVTISTVNSSLKTVEDNKYLNRPDMDIQYAMSLLKKDDDYIDVYSHLEAVLNKMLSERPSNPVENFELYSNILKLAYPTVNTRFESVFVDNINIMGCLRNLELYKCALNSQLEKQKRHERQKTNKEVKFSKYKKTTANESVTDEFNGFKQNLREANFLFNKAGCGLSENEVSIISTSMNHMAELNKFKSLRYWGKIFGVKKNYYIIECEWSESELHNRLSVAENVISSKSIEPKSNSFDSEKQPMSLSQLKDAPRSKQDFSIEYIGGDASSKVTEVLYQNAKENSTQFSFSSFVMPIESELVSKVGAKNMIPPEIQGFGANKSVYFVTNELNGEWIELPPVKPNHVIEARRIKYFLSGNLNAVINTYPKFNGLEIHYLRAQIARISSSTHICPQDFCEISSVEGNQLITPYSLLKSLPQLAKRIVFNCVPNIDFKPAANSKLMRPHYWVHVKSNIGSKGVTRQWAYLMATKSFLGEGDSKGVSGMSESEDSYSDYDGEALDTKADLLINLAKDSTVGMTDAWKGEQCSKFLPRDSCVAMKSNIWPGALAVSRKSQSEFLYVGWAQKYDFIGFSPLLEEFDEEHFAGRHIAEGNDPTHKQENEYNMHVQQLEQKINVFEQLSGEVYEGDERILNNYTYD